MKEYITITRWVQKCIESCINHEQLENSLKLIARFKIMYGHPTLYNHLVEIYSEHKTYLDHEKII
jgi:hypothetical protein